MSEAITTAAAYDLIDRFLRNNLYDDYYAEYSEALEALSQPAPSPQPFTPAQRMRLWQNTEKGKSATSLGAFERICQTVEAAHRIGQASPQPAVPVVRDDQIDAVSLDQWGPHHGAPLAAHRAFARAILALRPAVEPMTEWEIADIFERWDNTSGASMSDFVRMVEAHHGILPQAEGGV